MADLPLPPPLQVDPGLADARVGLDRRRTREQQRGRDRVRAALAGRVVRERRLDNLLDRELGPVAIVLHDRRVPGVEPTIDHVLVASSGVWLIDARHERGRVVRGRRIGRPRQPQLRLHAGGRVPLGVRPGRHADFVQRHLDLIGFGWLDVRRAVCLTNAGWGLVPRPFEIDGTWVIWGRALVAKVAVPGPLGPADMRAVAAALRDRFPAGA